RCPMTLLLLALANAAHAGPVEAAEHRRLSDEMKADAGRSVWSSVDEKYRKLVALDGETPTVDDHWYGAQAARALGDIAEAHARLEAGAKAGGSKEIIALLEEIDGAYGPARVTVDAAWVGDRTLSAAAPPLAPDQRAA